MENLELVELKQDELQEIDGGMIFMAISIGVAAAAYGLYLADVI